MADDDDPNTLRRLLREGQAKPERPQWFEHFREQIENPKNLRDLLIRVTWYEHSDEELERFRRTWGRSTARWLAQKWSGSEDQPCPFCGHDTWRVQSEPVRMDSALTTEASFGAAQVVCANCGQFVLVAAVHIPIVDEDEDVDE